MVFALVPASMAAASLDVSNVCPGPGSAPEFTDIPTGNVHADNIQCAANYGFTTGIGNNQYNPEGNVNRDQMATFIANLVEEAIDEDLPAPASAFTDIGSTVHAENINKLAAAGIVSGRTETTYAPTSPVRRDQMASFIANAIDYVDDNLVNESLPDATTTNPFDDVDSSNTHFSKILALRGAEVILGTSANSYNPAANIQRDQMATFIVNAASFLETEGLFPREPLPPEVIGDFPVTPLTPTTIDLNETITSVASELDDDLEYRVTLVDADTVQGVVDGDVVFTPGDDDGVTIANPGPPEAAITSINGTPFSGTPDHTVGGVSPVDGEITILSSSSVEETYHVVVYVDGGESTFLELGEDNTPIETYGASAAITVAADDTTPPGEDVTDGPELIDASVFNVTPTQTVIRYQFDEPVTSLGTGSFFLTSFNSDPGPAGAEARIEPGNQSSVLVNFPNYVAENATTANVEILAVNDADGQSNPESSAPVQTVSFDAGETTGANLVSIENVGGTVVDPDLGVIVVTASFVFDKPADLIGAAADYSLVLLTNETIDGDDVIAGNGTDTHTVEFTTTLTGTPPFSEDDVAQFAGDVVRGHVAAGTVENTREAAGSSAFAPFSVENQAQSANAAGSDGDTAGAPDLVSVEVDADLDRVRYTFDRNVAGATVTAADFGVSSNTADDPSGFSYVANGIATVPATLTGSTSTVVVQFADGAIDEQTSIAFVEEGAVTDSTNVTEDNQFHAIGASANSWAGEETTAPDLTNVEFNVTDSDPFTGRPIAFDLVYVFDEDLVEDTADYRVYNSLGQFVDISGACDATAGAGNEVVCSFVEGDPTFTLIEFRLIQDGVRAGVGIGAVEVDPDVSAYGYINYSTSRVISPS